LLPFSTRITMSSGLPSIAYPNFTLYHATKWGIGGFIEAAAREVAPFGIDFIIAEAGPTGTNFGASLVRPVPMDIYEDTPAAWRAGRSTETTSCSRVMRGRTVEAMISAADSQTSPFRLALGSTAYEDIVRELSKRLAAIEASRSRRIARKIVHCSPSELQRALGGYGVDVVPIFIVRGPPSAPRSAGVSESNRQYRSFVVPLDVGFSIVTSIPMQYHLKWRQDASFSFRPVGRRNDLPQTT
jgi:hypothetical protein